jgi:predicted transcriptional regulator of viral defense system
MKQLKALQTLQASGKRIFTSGDLQKILQLNSSTYAYILAKRLMTEGVLERVAKGYYILTSNKPTDFELANTLYQPSYVSLDSALNYYGILVQSPQQITSVSTKLTKNISSTGGKTFSYMHLNQKYFTDYQTVDGFLIATPEKALVDAMFATALGRSSLSIEELNLQSVDKAKVMEIAKRNTNRAFKNYLASIKL